MSCAVYVNKFSHENSSVYLTGGLVLLCERRGIVAGKMDG